MGLLTRNMRDKKLMGIEMFLLKMKIKHTLLDVLSLIWWQFAYCADCNKKIKGGFPRGEGLICAKCLIKEKDGQE